MRPQEVNPGVATGREGSLVTAFPSWLAYTLLLLLWLIGLWVASPLLLTSTAFLLAIQLTCHYYQRVAPYSKSRADAVQIEREVHNLHIRNRFEWPAGYAGDQKIAERDLCFHPTNTEIDGYVGLPSLGRTHTFRYSLDAHGRRRTAPTSSDNDPRPQVSIYGASVTFGLGLNDDQTFPWHVQRVFPDFRFVNFGVEGFSLYEMWLLMRHTLPVHKPRLAVVVLHPNTIGRDTGQYPTHHWIRGPRCITRRYPWQQDSYLHDVGIARLAAFARRTSLQTLEVLVSLGLSLPFWSTNRPAVARDTAFHVLRQMQQFCAGEGVPLVVLHLGTADGFGDFLEKHGFQWDCAGIQATSPDANGRYPHNLFPFDPTLHPNGEANRIYARTLARMLDNALHGNRVERSATWVESRREAFDKFVYPMF